MITVKEKTNNIKNVFDIDNILSIEEHARLEQLLRKQEDKVFEVAFCGHFSAGKSSILNKLLGAEILPTSPIPTSANIIGIKNGEYGLTIQSKKKQIKTWNGEIPWDQVRLWGMDGEEITEMTITAPLPFLGKHSCILDTPGVDSTDESHEAITVEQLSTTDFIVYVMDYNHVQSETNLYFLKQLSLEKKPIFIVINQVDKHNEHEIPFSRYKQTVEDVLRRWNIQYLRIYFTTTKHSNHHLNQFKTFEKDIKSLLFHSANLLDKSLQRLNQGLFKAVENRLLQQKQEKIDDILSMMEGKGYQIEQLEEQQQTEAQLQKIHRFDQELSETFERELGNLFKNVTLFPYTTTDLARKWIESIQPSFKVGLLFSKKKTIEEQEIRLDRLVKELQEKVKTQLLFHVTSFFQKVDRSELNNEMLFEEELNKIDFVVTSEWLKSHVKIDHTNRDYVFIFTAEITSLIVSDIRNKARKVLNIQIEGLKEYFKQEENALRGKLAKFRDIEEYAHKIEDTRLLYSKLIDKINQKLTTFPPANQFDHHIIKATQQSFPEDTNHGLTDIMLPEKSIIETEWNPDIRKTSIDFSEKDIKSWANKIKEALTKNTDKTILSQERNHLIERIDRFEKQTITVSLFGAFSAGKSSFANALLGDYVLPVSPNPTTATINTIEKSTKQNPHGTAKIILKTKKAINEEIIAVSEQLDCPLNINQLKNWKPNMKEYISSWQKTSAEYLLTMKESLDSTSWQLGSEFTVQLAEAQKFISNEQNACLVEKVKIYYDSPITNKGIILVDTPGVNSIYGRHTNVAFQQIRSSDAIFYLTYYNHAFSKADQYFLQQMGKVNESFQQDKLYFILNASDLANNDGELNGVKKHLYDQLVRNGIEQPRLFHLSSKKGLEAKKKREEQPSSFTHFEETFYQQTVLELKQLSHKLLVQQLQQYVDKINDSISFMNEEQREQEERFQKFQRLIISQTERVNRVAFDYVKSDVLLELDQLIIYLRERMRLVLNDYFSLAINVAVLTGNSKKELQQQLISAIKEWKGLGEYFLKQELEATAIRLEEKIKNTAKKWLTNELKKVQSDLPYTYIDTEVGIDAINSSVHDLHLSIESQKYFPYLKSKKDFFEKGKVKQLKESLIAEGLDSSTLVIKTGEKRLKSQVEDKLISLEKELKQKLTGAIKNELERFKALFNDKEKSSLTKEYEELSEII